MAHRLASSSLRHFTKQAWHVVEPARPYVANWHIDAICDHLEAVLSGELQHLLITVPPRHSKSLTVAVMWPCWAWIEQPYIRWLFASYAQTLSTRDSLKCRRLIESEWYQAHWGDKFKLVTDQNQKTRFETDATGYRLATSVEGSATGEGGDFLVIDDPHNIKRVESVIDRASRRTWYDQVWSTRLNDENTGGKVMVMQRSHFGDLAGHVLGQEEWVELRLPTKFEKNNRCVTVTLPGEVLPWQDPRTEEGELLNPQRYTPETVQRLEKVLGSYGFAAQHQQRPTPVEGGMFKKVWWRYWCWQGQTLPPVEVFDEKGNVVEIYAAPLPERFVAEVQSWDMAFKDAEEDSYVVGMVLSRLGADVYCQDMIRDHMDFPSTIRAVNQMSAKWPRISRKLVENKANGPAVIQVLRHSIGGLIEVNPDGSKESRAAANTPFVEAGNVYLPHPFIHSWTNDIIEEHAAFPRSEFDDIVDSMSQGLTDLYADYIMYEDAPAVVPVSMTRVNPFKF